MRLRAAWSLPLALVLVAYLALAAGYNAAVPLGEGPDEPGHAAYAFFLAREQRLPIQRADPRQSDVPGEGHQPPLAYALASLPILALPPDERRLDQPGNPNFTWAGGSEINAVAHGSRELPPWRGAALAWHLARLISALLGAATVGLTFLAARAVVGEERRASVVPLLAAGLVAFNPQFLFVSSLVTNDALLTALSAALLWLVVSARPEEAASAGWRPSGRALALGLVLGLALVTKQSALLLGPVALLGVLPWRVPARWRLLWRGSVIQAAWLFAAAALVSGWWYLRNWRLYGDPLGLAAFRAEFTTQAFDPRSLASWAGALAQLHESFWARFGWMNLPAPGWVLWLFGALEIAALAGLALSLRRGGPWPFVRHPALLLLPALALAWIVSFAFTAGLVAWQGRLLFPALPALAILLGGGLARLVGRRGRWPALAGGALALLALNGWLALGVIRPAYVAQTLTEREALSRLGTPVYGRFGLPDEPGTELRGWRLAGEPRPGAHLALTLMWHARGRQNRDWTVFVHLVDDRDRIVAQTGGQPRGGAFPMTRWVEGDWIEDTYQLALPPDLAPGRYTLRAGLYDPNDRGRRAGRYDQRGKLRGDSLDLGVISVTR